MKKIISILLLVLYSTTSFAIAIDVHYCGGGFSGISFPTFGETAQCGCDHSNPDHKECCTDKIISSKTDNHKTVRQYVIAETFSTDVLPDYTDWISINYNQPETVNNYNISSGFIRSHSPFYQAFLCIFRI